MLTKLVAHTKVVCFPVRVFKETRINILKSFLWTCFQSLLNVLAFKMNVLSNWKVKSFQKVTLVWLGFVILHDHLWAQGSCCISSREVWIFAVLCIKYNYAHLWDRCSQKLHDYTECNKLIHSIVLCILLEMLILDFSTTVFWGQMTDSATAEYFAGSFGSLFI